MSENSYYTCPLCGSIFSVPAVCCNQRAVLIEARSDQDTFHMEEEPETDSQKCLREILEAADKSPKAKGVEATLEAQRKYFAKEDLDMQKLRYNYTFDVVAEILEVLSDMTKYLEIYHWNLKRGDTERCEEILEKGLDERKLSGLEDRLRDEKYSGAACTALLSNTLSKYIHRTRMLIRQIKS